MQSGISCLLALVLVFSATAASLAQDDAGDQTDNRNDDRSAEERDMEAVQCVRIGSIDQIEIVDESTLIFHMRGDEVYRNDLPYQCPLRRDDTLMYRSSVGQLCNVDIITILNDWGFGFSPGASCGLGMFHPITAEIADELVRASE